MLASLVYVSTHTSIIVWVSIDTTITCCDFITNKHPAQSQTPKKIPDTVITGFHIPIIYQKGSYSVEIQILLMNYSYSLRVKYIVR